VYHWREGQALFARGYEELALALLDEVLSTWMHMAQMLHRVSCASRATVRRAHAGDVAVDPAPAGTGSVRTRMEYE